MDNSVLNTIEIENLSKSFTVATQLIPILKDVTFKIKDGEFVIIFGPSGSGKSTLLHSMLGLEEPTSGTVKYYGKDIFSGLNEDDRALFRKKHIGMIYQQPNWIKAYSVIENVGFPLMMLGIEKAMAMTRALSYLRKVKMEKWAYYRPTELSGGQQQRIALARALINNPYVIVADEPTGNLDFESGQLVMQLLNDLNKDEGKTIIMVTHDLEYLSYAQKAVRIFDGRMIGEYAGDDKEKLYSELKFKRAPSSTIVQDPSPSAV